MLYHSSCSVGSSLNCFLFFFFNDTATTEIYTLSLHDALPSFGQPSKDVCYIMPELFPFTDTPQTDPVTGQRSEEHTSELQSRENLVCRLLLEKNKKIIKMNIVFKKKTKPIQHQ